MTVLRDTALGALIRFVTRNKALRYPEEEPDFQLPEAWAQLLNANDPEKPQSVLPVDPRASHSSTDEESIALDEDEEQQREKPKATSPPSHDEAAAPPLDLQRTKTREETQPYTPDRLAADSQHSLAKTKSIPITPKRTKDGSAILVDWYTTDDPSNPQNWTRARRGGITALICLYTFVVYLSSAIYTTSEAGVMAEFNVDETHAALGLSLFVLGYGTGPLLFSPLSELPSVGRNPVYIATMFVYTILSIPTALVGSYPGLMALRFFQGFFGSPCLASGGASVGDMYSLLHLPYALIAWVSAAYCGPALGPLLSGFAVPVLGWRISLLEVIWAASPVFLAMFALLPETSSATILLRRAQRLRALTGDNRLQAQSELDQRAMTTGAVLVGALIKPLEITLKDPAILFVQLYTAIIYGIYYSFFEVFPLVYPVYYGMTPGEVGLVFLCVAVACLLGIAVYVAYLYWYLNPRIRARGWPVQESRLVPALFAAFGPTIGLFIFAWTAAPRFPWIAPTIGITVYGASVFVVMQCVFVYVPISYPKYAASLFAGNDFFRSALACGSILFAGPLFGNLGVARGTSLLGGLSTIGIIGIFLLYIYGGRLRAMSKFAVFEE